MSRLNLNVTKLTEEQKVAKHVSAMNDSLNLINRLMQEETHTKSVHDTIQRNSSHLELMMGKDFIKNSETDLTSFVTAVASAKVYIQTPVTES